LATPLGHVLVGTVSYSAVRSGKRWRILEALACGFLAASPDLDMVVSAVLTGEVGTFHRGLTHQPVFALLGFLAALTIGFLSKRGVTARVFLRSAFIAFLIFTHHVTDCWIRLPYSEHSWSGENNLPEVLSVELRGASASNYLIDFAVYGVLYSLLAFPVVALVRRVVKRAQCMVR
jgi:hypothetical protein